jgi:hypothetical protein
MCKELESEEMRVLLHGEPFTKCGGGSIDDRKFGCEWPEENWVR